ncbi:MAG: DUF6492 family protein [Balneolaceae bacterium]|nr:DUF6492 family protein [Balneolaceae bacterium]
MVYDTVLCAHADDSIIAPLAIHSIDHFLQSRKIFLITKSDVFKAIRKRTHSKINLHFLDEDELVEGLSLNRIEAILNDRMEGNVKGNWYYQQFLKMAVSQLPGIADHYLIWDSDTILMRPITFFDEDEHIFFNPKTEHHQPYFQFLQDLFGLEKQVNHSFIDQHLMIKKEYMQELIQKIREITPGKNPWYWMILQSIADENLRNHGFSEFETYGNFVVNRHPGVYKPRVIKTGRGGTSTYGLHPSRFDFFRLIKIGFTAVTFECRQERSSIGILLQKLKSRIFYLRYLWRSNDSGIRQDAKKIVGG